MRLVTLAASTILFASVLHAQAQDVGTSSILKSLMPKNHDMPLNADGSVSSGTTRGIKHMATNSSQPMSGAAVAAAPASSPAPADKPAVSLPVLFATGSAELTGAGRAQLDKLGAALKDPQLNGLHFRIEGHTDTAGDTELNQMLSERRARAVADYLTTQYGIARGQLTPVGMGKQGLAVPTPDQTPEARNRRVVIINLDG
jgi:outer membrane protein OmpA-like peptidoglycan-associated protein